MTTETEAGTPAVLHEALVTAAGPQRALTPVALRGLLAGVDTAVVAEVLGRVMAEGSHCLRPQWPRSAWEAVRRPGPRQSFPRRPSR